MRDYYEDLWQRLPDQLNPPELKLRSQLLQAELRVGARVLDIGCGAGQFSAIAARAGASSVIGVDVAQAALERARASFPQADFANLSFERVPFDGPLPFSDEDFDLIWASEVIEHVADTAVWMGEARRVLAPGGLLLITTPAHGRLRLLAGGIERYSPAQGDHLHLYTRRSLRGLLSDFGFASIDVGFLSGPPLLRRTLIARAQR